MEHRWNTRTPLDINITLNYDKVGLISARTRDISLGGAYIMTDSIRLGKHTMLEVLFPKDEDPGQMVNVPATVVRSDNSGIAIQFTDFDSRSIAVLTGWMSGASESLI